MLMRWKGLFVVLGAFVLATTWSVALAQDSQEPSEPTEQAQVPPEVPAEAPAEAPAEERTKKPFALYVYAGAGVVDANDINTSIATATTHTSLNTLTLDGMLSGRAEIGWKLPNKKGDFRLTFQGFAEDDYKFTAIGRAAQLPSSAAGNLNILDDLDWWTLTAEDGTLTSVRNPPLWEQTVDDANSNNSVDRAEVRYGDPNLISERSVTDDLQNRVQHIELTYGRTFGGRRYSGRWWGGLRSFKYEGNVLAGAWFNTAFAGEGFTDGTFLRLLNEYQQTKGLGPTGALEADLNLFSSRLVFYVKGQAAFMVTDLEMDTGDFFTLANTEDPALVVPVAARLHQTRDKSTWQTSGELGARVNLKNGVTFEAAWNVTGYLDALLLASSIQIPNQLGQAAQGTSAIFNTHDIVVKGTRFGVGFQF